MLNIAKFLNVWEHNYIIYSKDRFTRCDSEKSYESSLKKYTHFQITISW